MAGDFRTLHAESGQRLATRLHGHCVWASQWAAASPLKPFADALVVEHVPARQLGNFVALPELDEAYHARWVELAVVSLVGTNLGAVGERTGHDGVGRRGEGWLRLGSPVCLGSGRQHDDEDDRVPETQEDVADQ